MKLNKFCILLCVGLLLPLTSLLMPSSHADYSIVKRVSVNVISPSPFVVTKNDRTVRSPSSALRIEYLFGCHTRVTKDLDLSNKSNQTLDEVQLFFKNVFKVPFAKVTEKHKCTAWDPIKGTFSMKFDDFFNELAPFYSVSNISQFGHQVCKDNWGTSQKKKAEGIVQAVWSSIENKGIVNLPFTIDIVFECKN